MIVTCDREQIRLECLNLAVSGSADQTIKTAERYFDWVVSKPKRGRPIKKEENIDAKGPVRKHPS
jgi:hypothetical protein